MSRNAESHFAVNPTRIDMSRSRFDRSSSYKTTFNVGQIIPFYVDEVLPGDTFSIDTSKVVRMQTLLTPVMDDIFLDTYYFFVPNRLTWSHWKQFMGENTESAWIPSVEYEVPQLTAPEGGWNIGTIADYMGIPTGVSGLSVNALPFRAYALIMKLWKKSVVDWKTFLVFLLVFAGSVFLNISPVLYVLAAAVAGVVIRELEARKA